MKYDIQDCFIPKLPHILFRYGKPEGIVMHATDSFAPAYDEVAYMTRLWQEWIDAGRPKGKDPAFVHAFADWKGLVQTADTDFIAYGAGAVANKRYLHIELCQSSDFVEFKAAYDHWVWLAAFWLRQYKLQPEEGVTLWSHRMVTEQLGNTTHTDPDGYLSYHGFTWDNVVLDVIRIYQELGVEEYMLQVKDANKIITFLSAAYGATEDEEAQNEFHRLANELRKASGQPEE